MLNTPSVTLAARVGDASPSVGVSVTNSSPDAYTEGLKAAIGTGSAGFTASGAIANLGAGATDTSTLRIGLNTATAGSYSGSAALTLASTGVGTTGAADLGLPGQNVNLAGNVYTPAIALVSPAALDFGIVHVGEAVATRALNVTNAAPVTALNDVLRGSLGGATGPFSAAGTLGSGLAAGATDTSSLTVGLSTAAAGVFNGSAVASFVSHNDELVDLVLGDTGIVLSAQVNNYADPVFVKTGGVGSLSGSGETFSLDLGDFIVGSAPATAALAVLNDVIGPADLVSGSFDAEWSRRLRAEWLRPVHRAGRRRPVRRTPRQPRTDVNRQLRRHDPAACAGVQRQRLRRVLQRHAAAACRCGDGKRSGAADPGAAARRAGGAGLRRAQAVDHASSLKASHQASTAHRRRIPSGGLRLPFVSGYAQRRLTLLACIERYSERARVSKQRRAR